MYKIKPAIAKTARILASSAIIFALLSACAIFDLSPDGGFPTSGSDPSAYGTLAPDADFDFDQNRQL